MNCAKVLYGISSPSAISPRQAEAGIRRTAGEHQRLGLPQPASLWQGVVVDGCQRLDLEATGPAPV